MNDERTSTAPVLVVRRAASHPNQLAHALRWLRAGGRLVVCGDDRTTTVDALRRSVAPGVRLDVRFLREALVVAAS